MLRDGRPSRFETETGLPKPEQFHAPPPRAIAEEGGLRGAGAVAEGAKSFVAVSQLPATYGQLASRAEQTEPAERSGAERLENHRANDRLLDPHSGALQWHQSERAAENRKLHHKQRLYQFRQCIEQGAAKGDRL